VAIGINNNASSSVLRALNQAQQQSDVAAARLTSAQRINSAQDDAAGLAISNRLLSQVTGSNQAIRNAGDGISLAQTIEGSVATIQDGLQRFQELALQSANGALNDSDRQALQAEAATIAESIQDTVSKAQFNGKSLFNSGDGFSIRIDEGSGIAIPGQDLSGLADSISQLDISTQAAASTAIGTVKNQLDATSEYRAELGAAQNGLNSRISQLQGQVENEAAALSRVQDADFAREISSKIAGDIQQQVGIALQGQANADRGNVLRLLQ
jgi:flagellin